MCDSATFKCRSVGESPEYTRAGPREFAPFKYDEVTVENIKQACLSHFDAREGCVCDVFTHTAVRDASPENPDLYYQKQNTTSYLQNTVTL